MLDALDGRLSRLGSMGSTLVLTIAAVTVTVSTHFLLRELDGAPVRAMPVAQLFIEMTLVIFPMILYARRVIAELKRSKAELAAMGRKLEVAAEQAHHANRAKSQFLANMSHELRTPLNAVLGFTEMLELGLYGNMEAKQRECLCLIREASAHLLTMINDVLDLSKVVAGKLELSVRKEDLSALADRVVTLMIGIAHEKGVVVKAAYEPDLPLVIIDERFVKQMLMNLLSNAIKFTPRGGTITVITQHGHDGCLTLAVSDTGIGIPKNKHAHVLEPFRQADTDMMHSRTGTGLGLPIVKSLIELHGGQLELESEEGRGTSVSLHFPAGSVAS